VGTAGGEWCNHFFETILILHARNKAPWPTIALGGRCRFHLVFELLVLLLELSHELFVIALGAMQRLDTFTLVFDKLLICEQVFLHGLPSHVHLLHC